MSYLVVKNSIKIERRRTKGQKEDKKHIQQTHQKNDNLLIIKPLMGFVSCA